ncbi:acyl-CoA dehydrogenase [Epidermidibacterium keratini]|uniref:Broad-specificity linear acyl-CoA dehydrogenase FadE5 n=1 Tax=Epidermidibacterium keratini TaxID=1891644 RepID=A0A7L4YM19_9ACTN|nr:acyl-CoA dehydrogenase [Epidermidibacterium keratini]QHC00180.1 acyl-CoA dehydrogenase [Epidermidibacterium keratini]
MAHYKSNLRDIEFNLFEVLNTQDRLGSGVFEELDLETAKDFLANTHERATSEAFCASFADADRNPPVYNPQDFSVVIPDSFKRTFEMLMESGGHYLDMDAELGGTPAPRTLWWSIGELILGANPAAWMYAAGPAFANILYSIGTDEQKDWARLFIDKLWGATMVLTEPDAGSDVGAGVTKAFPNEDGTWRIEGVKRFITSAEQDMTDNIIHYVLARPEGVSGAGGPGTKGLSLFIVPKFHFDPQTGEIGERNGAFVTNVEKKMGIKVSTTCELTFGQHGTPAIGYLVGDVHEGIAQMFRIIEYARMMVGTKGMATLSSAYLNALDYAKTRKQGADLTQANDKSAPRIEVIGHPDVKRSLMLQKSYAEGLRAMVLYTAYIQELVQIAKFEGNTEEVDRLERINDLMLPLVKACGSERAYTLIGTESLQCFGGSGYLQDYPIEQYVRDSKIDTLYEGTTAIQGMDFFFRKIVKDKGASLMFVAQQIQELAENQDVDGRLKTERELLAQGLADAQAMLGGITGFLMSAQDDITNIYKVGQNTSRLLLAMGDLVMGWQLLKHATIALAKLDEGPKSEKDKAFYEGKVASARFFCSQVLPRLSAEKAMLEATDNSIMDIPVEAF